MATVKIVVPADNISIALGRIETAMQYGGMADWGYARIHKGRGFPKPIQLPDGYFEMKKAAAAEQAGFARYVEQGGEIADGTPCLQDEFEVVFDGLGM